MKTVSRSVGSLRKIDFVEALLHARAVVPHDSVTFEDPGILGVACVSYNEAVPTFKPPAQAYHGIGYRVSGSQTVRTDRPRSFARRTGRSGMTAIVPAAEESSWFSEGPHEMVHFYISARLVGELASEIYGADERRVELQEAGFHVDESLARYAMAFRQRMSEPEPITELELNAVANLLGTHLLRRYSNLASRPVPRLERKLSGAEVNRVTEYVVAHLDSALRLAELAAVVGMNPYRFARGFQAATGDSPHKYIMRLRVARAQDLLAGSPLSLGAIAATVGFSSQSHMTLAFQRNLSITPGRFRNQAARSSGAPVAGFQ